MPTTTRTFAGTYEILGEIPTWMEAPLVRGRSVRIVSKQVLQLHGAAGTIAVEIPARSIRETFPDGPDGGSAYHPAPDDTPVGWFVAEVLIDGKKYQLTGHHNGHITVDDYT